MRIPWQEKLTQRQLIQENEDLSIPQNPVLCGDSNTTCPPMSTCCQMINQEYSCCPYDEGVCCGTHCCPRNFKCGQDLGECIKENVIESELKQYPDVNWHTIETLAYPTGGLKEVHKISNAVCPGGEVQCTNGTCCQIQADSSYACCMIIKFIKKKTSYKFYLILRSL